MLRGTFVVLAAQHSSQGFLESQLLLEMAFLMEGLISRDRWKQCDKGVDLAQS